MNWFYEKAELKEIKERLLLFFLDRNDCFVECEILKYENVDSVKILFLSGIQYVPACNIYKRTQAK